MIRSFRSRALQRFAERGYTSKLSVPNVEGIGRVIRRLDVITVPEDANLPGWRFHRLTGDQKGRYAVTVSGNWQITFGWDGDDAVDVDLEDYH